MPRMLPAVVRIPNKELVPDDTVNTHPSARLSPNALIKLSFKNSLAKPLEHCESIHTTDPIVISVQPLLKDTSYVLPPLVVQMRPVISNSSPPLSWIKFAAILSFRAIESVLHAISESISESLDGGVLSTLRPWVGEILIAVASTVV